MNTLLTLGNKVLLLLDNVDQIWDHFSYYMDKEVFFSQIIASPQIKLVLTGNILEEKDCDFIKYLRIGKMSEDESMELLKMSKGTKGVNKMIE